MESEEYQRVVDKVSGYLGLEVSFWEYDRITDILWIYLEGWSRRELAKLSREMEANGYEILDIGKWEEGMAMFLRKCDMHSTR